MVINDCPGNSSGWKSYFQILTTAFTLGFISMSFQLELLSTTSRLFKNDTLLVGIALASWIFLTGTGSILARHIEKMKNKQSFLWTIFLSMPLLAILSNLLIFGSLEWHISGKTISMPMFTVFIFISFVPLCLANGTVFSLIAQTSVDRRPSAINKIYALESMGGLLGGLVFYFNPSQQMGFWVITNFVLSALVFVASTSPVKLKILLPTTIAIIIVLCWNITKQFIPAGSFLLSQHSSYEPIQLIDYVIIFGLFLLVSAGMIHRFPPIGRTLFVTGFAGLSMEILLIMIYKKICTPDFSGSVIIISICMAGLALGALLPLPNTLNLKTHFTRLLFGLTFLSITAACILFYGESDTLKHRVIPLLLLMFGALFSAISGALFSVGVCIQNGSAGGVVATTFGPDMIGASLGALVVSSLLIPEFGVSGVAAITSVLLLSSTAFTMMWKP